MGSTSYSVWSFSGRRNGQPGPIKYHPCHSYHGDRENTSQPSYFYAQNSYIKEQFGRCMIVGRDARNLRGADGSPCAGRVSGCHGHIHPAGAGHRAGLCLIPEPLLVRRTGLPILPALLLWQRNDCVCVCLSKLWVKEHDWASLQPGGHSERGGNLPASDVTH